MVKIWTYDALCSRCAEPSKQLDELYNDMLKLLRLHGLTVQPDETLVTFPKRVDRVIVLENATFAGVADAMMDSHFGNIQPSVDEVKRVCIYHRRLETWTLEVLGKRKYLLKRVRI